MLLILLLDWIDLFDGKTMRMAFEGDWVSLDILNLYLNYDGLYFVMKLNWSMSFYWVK